MAVADAPGLMDIASTLAQDEIPFKLRCAICNNLAVNAFRLPCCDQSICETCQASLSDTCPVCTHTPVSPDLCKPNKALRTTLKAFLRTEEKKREKDRQSVAANDTPADTKPSAESTPQNGEPTPAREPEAPLPAESTEPTESKPEVPEVSALVDAPVPHTAGESAQEPTAPDTVGVADAADHPVQHEAPKVEANTEPAFEAAAETPAEPTVNGNSAPAQEISDEPSSTSVPNTGGNFPPMGWNGNATNPYMAGMYNFPNSMGMSMGMDPMANQGMFGDYGMNMTGMGMNSGMNYNGGMYGSLGWDASQNNNMWQGGQDNFNPNAFANGTGPPYGGAFGSNMSYPSSDYQSGYYGQGYGRGGFRGRGRGQYHGPGRGGFGPMHGHYRANSGYSNQNPTVAEGFNQGNPTNPGSSEQGVSGDNPGTDNLQGIPTIDSLQSVSDASPYYAPGPGVEGAPAAPRAMRQGLPNTSVFRQRGFQIQGRASSSGQQPDTANVQGHVQSRSRSKSAHPTSRPHSPSVHGTEDGQDGRRELETKPMDRVEELQSDARRSPSPSRTSSRRSSRRRHHDSDRERDRKDSHRSQRSRRHRSPSHSSSRNGDSRPSARLNVIEENNSNGRTKRSSEAPESRDLASRISSSRRSEKDRVSRREDDRSRAQDRDSRRRDRDRDHDRDRRDRDRDTDHERRRDDRDKDRTADRDRDRRDRPKDRERDRKRSRRDRSPSANGNDHPHARRVKRDEDRSLGQSNGASTKKSEPEKDPYTLEREARNKERLQREQQHREKAKSGRRHDSRQDRVVGGRRINYKYEDEL